MQDKRNHKDENGIENRKTTEKINETKCWFFQKLIKLLSLQIDGLGEKRKQFTNTKNERYDMI